MNRLRKADDRGHVDHGWLDTWHTFSFASYHDEEQMGFGPLRVINEDFIAGGTGFGSHPHRDMEIVTYVISGALEHQDSMGNGSIIRPGEVQRMTAGSGVVHSEKNPSKTESIHLLQIWILPDAARLKPEYEQKMYSAADKANRLQPIASPDGRGGSLTIHQDATVFASILEAGHEVNHSLAEGRSAWLQLITGRIDANGVAIGPGDGLAIEAETSLLIRATESAEFLLFDLP